MERVLQWLDELEDLFFCLPLLWPRVRGWLLILLGCAAFSMLLLVLPGLALVALAALLLGVCTAELPTAATLQRSGREA